MKLRTRLIVAFLLLSVVPLGAVTFYSYRSNVDAMQEVATREADLLAGELSQRMQLVTAQLSDAVEHLMEVPQPVTRVATVTPAPAAKSETAKPAVTETEQFNQQVAKALGEAAILLNSVQMQPSRGFGRGDGRGDGRGGPPGRRTSSAVAGGIARNAAGHRHAQRPDAATDAATDAGRRGGHAPRAPGVAAAGMPPTSGRGSHPPPGPGGPGTVTFRFGGPGPGGPGSSTGTVHTDDGTQIDLSQIRRDLYRQILPNGSQETLTPEELPARGARSEPADARHRGGDQAERRRASEESRPGALWVLRRPRNRRRNWLRLPRPRLRRSLRRCRLRRSS